MRQYTFLAHNLFIYSSRTIEFLQSHFNRQLVFSRPINRTHDYDTCTGFGDTIRKWIVSHIDHTNRGQRAVRSLATAFVFEFEKCFVWLSKSIWICQSTIFTIYFPYVRSAPVQSFVCSLLLSPLSSSSSSLTWLVFSAKSATLKCVWCQ